MNKRQGKILIIIVLIFTFSLGSFFGYSYKGYEKNKLITDNAGTILSLETQITELTEVLYNRITIDVKLDTILNQIENNNTKIDNALVDRFSELQNRLDTIAKTQFSIVDLMEVK